MACEAFPRTEQRRKEREREDEIEGITEGRIVGVAAIERTDEAEMRMEAREGMPHYGGTEVPRSALGRGEW
jgi:hypothetical protein